MIQCNWIFDSKFSYHSTILKTQLWLLTFQKILLGRSLHKPIPCFLTVQICILKNFSNFCSMPILAAVCMYASNSNYHYHYYFYCTLQFIFCRQVVVFSAPKEKVHVETFITPAPTPKKQSKTNQSFLHKCLFWILLFSVFTADKM